MNAVQFNSPEVYQEPYIHFATTDILQHGLEKDLHDWFEQTKLWHLTEMDFYTQFEFSFFDIDLPDNIQQLVSTETISKITDQFKEVFGKKDFEVVGITAHKLVDGHKISVHNDFIGDEETHRLLIQINPNWTADNGGYLMLFNSQDSKDLCKIVEPLYNTGFGFEINQKSYHAVSSVYNYSRYTLVYTFKAL